MTPAALLAAWAARRPVAAVALTPAELAALLRGLREVLCR